MLIGTESGQFQNQQYLTIIQDPYPPLNCSPEFYDSADGNNFTTQMSMMDCIDMNELDNSFTKEINDIKKEHLFEDNNDKI